MRRAAKWDEQKPYASWGAVICASLFLLGAVIGSYFSANLSANQEGFLFAYPDTLSSLTAAEIFWRYFLTDMTLLFCIFIFGFFRFGVIMSPFALAVKGFFLSVAVTAYVKAFGFKGFLTAFFSSFVSGFIVTACLFLLALQAFALSCSKARGGKRMFRRNVDRIYFLRAGFCALVIICISLIRSYLSPVVTQMAFKILN